MKNNDWLQLLGALLSGPLLQLFVLLQFWMLGVEVSTDTRYFLIALGTMVSIGAMAMTATAITERQ